eukprot:5692443-Amphidinium_carterae.1
MKRAASDAVDEVWTLAQSPWLTSQTSFTSWRFAASSSAPLEQVGSAVALATQLGGCATT